MTPAQKEEIKARFAPVWESPGVLNAWATAKRCAEWSKFFFGDKNQPAHYHVRENVPQFHIDYYAEMFSECKLSFICAPSEFGKTTTGTLIYPLYRIIYFNEPYTVIASRIAEIAEEYLAEIKSEITDNQKLISVYGSLKSTKKRGAREDQLRWSMGYVELANGSRIRAVGWNGNVRGRKRGAFRITLFIGDDPEEIEDVESVKTLKKNRRWLNRSVLKRLDKDYGKARITGTLLNQQCLLAYLSNNSLWKGKVYTALVKDEYGVERSIWEDRWPTAYLQAERASAEKNGELEDWYYERMNKPPDHLDKKIEGYIIHSGEYVREYGANALVFEDYPEPVPVYTWLAVDPAFGQDEDKHDPRGIVLFAKGRILKRNNYTGDPYWLNMLWVLEEKKEWMAPDQVLDVIMDYHKKYYLEGFIVEAISGQQIYEPLLARYTGSDYFYSQNPCQQIFPKHQPKNKKKRIANGLQPRCKLGQIAIRAEHEHIKSEFDNFNVIENPNMLDALEFGNRYSTECTVKSEKRKTDHYKRKKAIKYGLSQDTTWRGWAPSSLSDIGVN